MKKHSLAVKSRLWITYDGGTFLGEGRITLLQEIERTGSISRAAHAMGMSYPKAWRLLESMNKRAEEPLAIRSVGGKGGGGTTVTQEGKNAIKLYQELNGSSKKVLRKALSEAFQKMKLNTISSHKQHD